MVPGPVSALTAGPEFVSVLISWGAPQEPNGLIIAYEVTYRVASGDVVRTNTTDVGTSLEIPSLAPLTTVSDISVTAYTSVGPGEVTTHDSVVTPEEPQIREYSRPSIIRTPLSQDNLPSVRMSEMSG